MHVKSGATNIFMAFATLIFLSGNAPADAQKFANFSVVGHVNNEVAEDTITRINSLVWGRMYRDPDALKSDAIVFLIDDEFVVDERFRVPDGIVIDEEHTQALKRQTYTEDKCTVLNLVQHGGNRITIMVLGSKDPHDSVVESCVLATFLSALGGDDSIDYYAPVKKMAEEIEGLLWQ